MNTNKFASVSSFLAVFALCALSTGCAASFRGTARGTIYTTAPTVYVEPAYAPPPPAVVVAPVPPPVLVQPPMLPPPPPATMGGSVYVNVPPVTVYGGAGVSVDTGRPRPPHRRHCDLYGCR